MKPSAMRAAIVGLLLLLGMAALPTMRSAGYDGDGNWWEEEEGPQNYEEELEELEHLPEGRLLLEPPLGVAHTTQGNRSGSTAQLTGTLQVVHVDHDAGGADSTYFLAVPGEAPKKLLFTNPLLGSYLTGDTVRVTYKLQDTLPGASMTTIIVLRLEKAARPSGLTPFKAPRLISTITFVLSFTCGGRITQPAALSPEVLKKVWFNSYAAGSPYTLQNFFGSCSLGASQFLPENNPVIAVPLPCRGNNNEMAWSSSSCEVMPDAYGWGYAAEAYAKMQGYNLHKYPIRMMLLPNNSACDWAGLGNLGCGDSCYVWVKGSTLDDPSAPTGFGAAADAFAHEMGHTLNLDHSGSAGDEYDDMSSAMGYCCTLRCYSSPQLYHLGWASPLVTYNAANLTRRMTHVVPGRTAAQASFIRVVPDWKGPTKTALYVSFLAPSTWDQYMEDDYLRKVVVHTWAGSPGTWTILKTNLRTMLSPGMSWVDPNWGLQVTFTAISGGAATVSVCAQREKTEVSCFDGIDNDCDGLIDAADPNCAAQITSIGRSSPRLSPPPSPARPPLGPSPKLISHPPPPTPSPTPSPKPSPPPSTKPPSPSPKPPASPPANPPATPSPKPAPPAVCGNGVCEATKGETAILCPRDCLPVVVCGDRFCDKARKETAQTCPADCPATCGDSYCDAGRGESIKTCSYDCLGSCGDGYCNAARGETVVTCPKDCPSRAVCGDKFCNKAGGETAKTCPADCPVQCGDNFCDTLRGESSKACPYDCSAAVLAKQTAWCGDSVCNHTLGETMRGCPADCWFARCGDGFCDVHSGEDGDNCPFDCYPGLDGTCGDMVCDLAAGEGAVTCPADCPAVCNDGFCDTERGEDSTNCLADCPTSYVPYEGSGAPVCGNGICQPPAENFVTCAADCKPACGDGICSAPAETHTSCPRDCRLTCGDGHCEGSETAATCPADCCTEKTVCGDGRCDAFAENCVTCPDDCASLAAVGGQPAVCCGQGAGCSSAGCRTRGFQCVTKCSAPAVV